MFSFIVHVHSFQEKKIISLVVPRISLLILEDLMRSAESEDSFSTIFTLLILLTSNALQHITTLYTPVLVLELHDANFSEITARARKMCSALDCNNVLNRFFLYDRKGFRQLKDEILHLHKRLLIFP